MTPSVSKANHPADRILGMQWALGNQAVQRLLRSGVIQAKLKIGQPGDRYEREADRVAELVMRMPDSEVSGTSEVPPKVQRKCATWVSGHGLCPNCAEEEEVIQRKPLASTITPLIQRQSEELLEEDEEETLQAKEVPGRSPEVTGAAPWRLR